MTDFITAIGLMLVFEGILYGGFPGGARRMAEKVAKTPDNVLQNSGLIVALIGIIIIWLIRGWA